MRKTQTYETFSKAAHHLIQTERNLLFELLNFPPPLLYHKNFIVPKMKRESEVSRYSCKTFLIRTELFMNYNLKILIIYNSYCLNVGYIVGRIVFTVISYHWNCFLILMIWTLILIMSERQKFSLAMPRLNFYSQILLDTYCMCAKIGQIVPSNTYYTLLCLYRRKTGKKSSKKHLLIWRNTS